MVVLVSLNITDIFDQQRANLTGISDKPIEVGDILHAASIKVGIFYIQYPVSR